MTTTYDTVAYRIQSFDPAALLDPAEQFSTNYADLGGVAVEPKRGKSVCRSIEDLAYYFAQAGVPCGDDAVLVTLGGDWSEDEDDDADLGAHLVYPRVILDATPVDDTNFFDLVNAYLGDD